MRVIAKNKINKGYTKKEYRETLYKVSMLPIARTSSAVSTKDIFIAYFLVVNKLYIANRKAVRPIQAEVIGMAFCIGQKIRFRSSGNEIVLSMSPLGPIVGISNAITAQVINQIPNMNKIETLLSLKAHFDSGSLGESSSNAPRIIVPIRSWLIISAPIIKKSSVFTSSGVEFIFMEFQLFLMRKSVTKIATKISSTWAVLNAGCRKIISGMLMGSAPPLPAETCG